MAVVEEIVETDKFTMAINNLASKPFLPCRAFVLIAFCK